MSSLKLSLHWCAIFTVALLLTGCGEEDENGLSFAITAGNAQEVVDYGLDIAEVGSISKLVAETVDQDPALADRMSVNETVNCSDLITNATGTVLVTGAVDPEINLTIQFVDCATNSGSLNGSVTVSKSVVGTTKTTSVDGSMSATDVTSGLSIAASQFFYDKVSDTVTAPNEYSKNYGMTVSVPILGAFSVDGAITGDDLANPDKPIAGSTVIMTGTKNSKVRLTSVGLSGYTLEVDEDGDDVYELTLQNGLSDIFPWL